MILIKGSVVLTLSGSNKVDTPIKSKDKNTNITDKDKDDDEAKDSEIDSGKENDKENSSQTTEPEQPTEWLSLCFFK